MRIDRYGISIDLPDGWEGRIYRRPEGDPTLHAGNFALPATDGDFGSNAIGTMPDPGVFVVFTEYAADVAGTDTFAHQGVPVPIPRRAVRKRAFQKLRPGRYGVQRFCTVEGRPFCLYVVVGNDPDPGMLVDRANRVLVTLAVSPA